ncbi:hypothetical protein [Amycolatopsis pithecellobii]|uniref:Uncharacterized protein n=1 Tax=Amycolatopsis pithecellobii TaxID=664692 RepID=A0A6N7YYR9_9PSEU|nr:hypothetical protein [Amycolatopsis pithecellobii]MTD54043.1 hypothetical protein [Amycolatopsis pithecellobii]
MADEELDQTSASIVSYRLSRLIALDEERRGPDKQPRNQVEFARHLEKQLKRYTKQHVNAVVNYWKRPGERNPRISFELVDEAGAFGMSRLRSLAGATNGTMPKWVVGSI